MAEDQQGGGLLQRVRIVLDEAAKRIFVGDTQQALRQGTDPAPAQANAGRLASIFNGLKARAVAMGAAIAGALAIGAVVAFGRAAVAAALEAREPWARLGAVLRNVGVNLKDVQGEIDAVAASMERLNVDDEQTASILATLVNFSQDYGASLQNIQLVADLAAAKQMDLGSAADLVGKVMAGNTDIAKRYIGEFAEGADVLDLMRQRFSGTAEAISAQRGGLDQVTIAWGNFREAVGEAILAGGKGSNVMDVLRAIIVALTTAVRDNQDGIAAMAGLLLSTGRIVGGVVLATFSAFFRIVQASAYAHVALAAGIQAVAHALGIATPTLDAHVDRMARFINAADAAAEAAWNLAKATAGNGPVANPSRPRNAPVPGRGGDFNPGAGADPAGGATAKAPTAEDRERLLLDAMGHKSTRGEAAVELRALEESLEDELAQGNLSLQERVALEERLAQVRQGLGRDTADAVGYMNDAISEAFTLFASGAGGPQQALDMILEGVTEVDSAMDLLGKDAWKALAENAKKEAKIEAVKSAAHAITQGALGIARLAVGDGAGATAHFTSAKAFALSALKWAALAGGAGIVAGGGGGRGGGGGTGSAGNAGNSQARDAEKRGPDIYLQIDGVDPNNPRHHELVGETTRQWQERTGGTVVYNGRRT